MLAGVTVDVSDLDRSRAFYATVFGVHALRRGPSPELVVN